MACRFRQTTHVTQTVRFAFSIRDIENERIDWKDRSQTRQYDNESIRQQRTTKRRQRRQRTNEPNGCAYQRPAVQTFAQQRNARCVGMHIWTTTAVWCVQSECVDKNTIHRPNNTRRHWWCKKRTIPIDDKSNDDKRQHCARHKTNQRRMDDDKWRHSLTARTANEIVRTDVLVPCVSTLTT